MKGAVLYGDPRNEGKPAMQSVWPLLDGGKREEEEKEFIQVQRVCR